MRTLSIMAILTTCLTATPIAAQETLVTRLKLPFKSIEQEVTYHPSRSDYETARARILAALRKGDPSARVNPSSGPWLRAETTTIIGIEYRGLAAGQGRKSYRQVSAAEEALYLYEASGN